MGYDLKINISLFLTLLSVSVLSYAETVKIEYLVPMGFSASDETNTLQLLGILEGKTLPGPITYSESEQRLQFNQQSYRNNHINEESIILLEKILSQIPYLQCQNGCDYMLLDHRVSLDKINRTLTITNNNYRYLMPATTWGLVNNQSLDMRMTADHYRAMFVRGQSYIGLPWQSYGFANWFYNTTRSVNSARSLNNEQSTNNEQSLNNEQSTNNKQSQYQRLTQKGFGSWYLQKNFAALYLRTGRQNSLDNTAGSIHTLINPMLDQFITLGSQSYLAIDKPSSGSLVLYATQDGDYEIYRDNQLIRRFPAQLGRNEIDYNQLPGGYYNVEIRLVDRLGNVISQENQTISNIGNQTNNGWFLTFGKGSIKSESPRLMQFGRSMAIKSLQTNITLLKDTADHWATEANASRSLDFNAVNITPTFGLMSGEKRSGGYLRINGGNNMLGYLSLARYQAPYVSVYAPDSGSTSASYTRRIGLTQLSYQFNQYKNNRQHRIQTSREWQLLQSNLAVSLGLQKGGQWNSNRNYGVFLNTSLSFGQKSSANINTAYTQQQLHTSASYQQDFVDHYGVSTLGISGSHSGKIDSIGSVAKRSGSRGDITGRLGVDNKITNGGISYNGMLALGPQGVALGRSSYSGAALLIKTPSLDDTPYSFYVENSPITGGGLYAVPIPRYQDRFFVRTHSDRNDIDMHIQLPVNIVRAHPGQVFSGEAEITLNLLYSGFLKDTQGRAVTGVIEQTGDTAHPNGLFSISTGSMLKTITVRSPAGRYRCDMRQQPNHIYLCHQN